MRWATAKAWLHVADADALPQAPEHVGPFGHELLGDEAFEASVDNGLHDGRVVQFLRLIDLSPSGHAARMIVRKICVVFADGGDDVAFHDLHVVDVIE